MAIRRRRSSKALMGGSNRHSSRSIRLMCLPEGLPLLSTAQVRQVTIIGPLPTKARAVVRRVVCIVRGWLK